jgi:hypothetical protein
MEAQQQSGNKKWEEEVRGASTQEFSMAFLRGQGKTNICVVEILWLARPGQQMRQWRSSGRRVGLRLRARGGTFPPFTNVHR